VARHADTRPRTVADQTTLLDELKRVAEGLGFQVRQEKLLREVGYRVRSGSCRVRDRRVIIVDRTLSLEAQIDVLVDELAGEALDDTFLSPHARYLIERAAGRPAASEARPA